MSDEAIKVRVTHLEESMKDIRDNQGQIYSLLREVRESQIAIQATVGGLRQCAQPNLCLELKKIVEEHEKMFQKAAGVGVAAKALWAFAGAGGIGIVAAAYHLLTAHAVH